jgi:hypothetical protein
MYNNPPILTPEQYPCEPVRVEFGDPLDRGLLYDTALEDVHMEIANNIEASHAQTATYLEDGTAANRAIQALGCTACDIVTTCPVREILEQKATLGQERLNIEKLAHEIVEAPRWLKVARQHNGIITSERMEQIISDTDVAREALEDGTIDAYLGSIRSSKKIGTMTKADLSEISDIPAIDEHELLDAYEIRTAAGHTFTVIDASLNNDRRDNVSEENRREYGILCTKFVARLSQVGQNDSPLIMHQDQIIQKTIMQLGDGRIDELRMSGKNRFYVSIKKQPEGSGVVARIVLLGSHGGDASTQRKFINTIRAA